MGHRGRLIWLRHAGVRLCAPKRQALDVRRGGV